MILADTSIWIDHLKSTDTRFEALLDARQVAMHPFVLGELAMGSLRGRTKFLQRLEEMPKVVRANDYLVLQLVETQQLYSRGLTYIDAHLLAAVRLADDFKLLTRDARLLAAATRLGVEV